MPFGLLTEILFCLTSASAFSVKQFMKDGQTQILNEPIPGESPLELCDSLQPQILTLDSLKMDPVPPERGENLTIIASGTLSAPVEEGAYVDVDVDYGLIKLIHATYDLCEELPNVDMKCPIKKGHYELNKKVEIPSQVPPGQYKVVARAYTKDDELITCLTGEVVFPPYGWSMLESLKNSVSLLMY
ncbi:hypothetical protein HII12_001711 [Brettanomyces bruxellensis]|uniref:Phosphatidylglycerol/phosphatidylinositol transfer protein n=1 Tax=Dekkera bruxellensis TaxID=5007 RepID=A0A7D9CVF9_DEKBR|nr:phosphatidylglycerol phosphatidylinositol transfer protein precursor [Brettanomyces bruxellensis AWRI1499]KAF6012996.1 hypothetical protein HII12_001711 [Brettanomyces bruxellensis]VUG16073.1 NPC2 [Brettanomyces bruxellensis]